MKYLALEDEAEKLPGPLANTFRLVIVRFVLLLLCEKTTRDGSVAHCRGRRCQEAIIRSCYCCRRAMGGNLLFARVVPSIDIVKLQGCVSVNLNNDLARGHRVVVHVRVEIGEAAGRE